jgi:opacity protein-like surface antigen
MKRVLPFVVLFLISGIVLAQQRWSAEIRPGISIPTEKLGDNEIRVGYGLEAKIGYKLMPHLKVQAGWGWSEFRSGSGSQPPNIKLDETGYSFGFELTLPVSNPPLAYYLFAEGIYCHIEIEDITNSQMADSDHGLGWQLGGGLAYEFAPQWNIRPEVKYHSLKRDVELMDITQPVSLNYLGFSIALLRSF